MAAHRGVFFERFWECRKVVNDVSNKAKRQEMALSLQPCHMKATSLWI